MIRNDWNHTAAAALFGAMVGLQRKNAALVSPPALEVAEDASDIEEVPVTAPVIEEAPLFPNSWNELDEELRKDLVEGIAFLASYAHGTTLDKLDREKAAYALISFLKDRPIAAYKIPHGIAIDVFISVRQAFDI